MSIAHGPFPKFAYISNMQSHAGIRSARISSPPSDHSRRPYQLMSPNINSCISDDIVSNRLASLASPPITCISSCQLILTHTHHLEQKLSSWSPPLSSWPTHILSLLEHGTKKAFVPLVNTSCPTYHIIGQCHDVSRCDESSCFIWLPATHDLPT